MSCISSIHTITAGTVIPFAMRKGMTPINFGEAAREWGAQHG